MAINPLYHHTESQLEQELVWINESKLQAEKFAPLYKKYYKSIFRYAYQRLDSVEIAADITSQVFLKALSNLNSYQFKGVPFASWLYRIAYNELMIYFKQNKNSRTVNFDGIEMRLLCEENQEKYFEEYIPHLKNIMSGLKEIELQFIEMRYFEKRSFKEIAEILEITEVNAKVKMHRVIEKLKIEIKKIKI